MILIMYCSCLCCFFFFNIQKQLITTLDTLNHENINTILTNARNI